MEIQLSGFKVFLSDEDFELLSDCTYRISKSNGKPYLRLHKNGKYFYAHRLICGAKKNESVDHINGNSLDNRRENLRICSHQQNQCNQNVKDRDLPRGVFRKKGRKKLRAQISVNLKTVLIGHFVCPTEAHVAYLFARSRYYGDFARIER